MKTLILGSLILVFAGLPSRAEVGDAARGADVFASNCAVCHGLEAKGDGPMSEVLLVAPPDLTVLAATNGGTFPATYVAYRIDGRSPVVSHGGDMPIFGRLFGMPSGSVASETGQPIITAQPIADVVEWLRSVQAE